jgi:ribonuclease P protein component
MPPSRRRHVLPRSARIRSGADFTRIFTRKTRVSDRWLTLYGTTNTTGLPRLGLAVGRRVGNAVRRNRLKRLIREAFRQVRHDLPPGMDYIVVPRSGQDPTVSDLAGSLLFLGRELARRLNRDVDTRPRRKHGAGVEDADSSLPG